MHEASWIDAIEIAWDGGSSPAGSSAAFAQLERLCAGTVTCDLHAGPVTGVDLDAIARLIADIDTRAHRLAGPATSIDVLVLGPRSVVASFGDLWLECERSRGWLLSTLDGTFALQRLALGDDSVTIDDEIVTGVEPGDARSAAEALGPGTFTASTIPAGAVFAPLLDALRASAGRSFVVRAVPSMVTGTS